MANYSKKNSHQAVPAALFRTLMWSSLSFIAGYLSASYYNMELIGAWVQQHVLAEHPVLAKVVQPQETVVPKPKFEFYTLLTTPESAKEDALDTHDVAVAVVKPMPVKSEPVSKRGYLIQVAAFRVQSEALRMKASLLRRGFEVGVSPVLKQNTQWFRVIVGPFASRQEAELAQKAIAKTDRLNGMIQAEHG